MARKRWQSFYKDLRHKYSLYYFAPTAMREDHRPQGSNSRNAFPRCSGGQKGKTKMAGGWVSPEAPLLDLWLDLRLRHFHSASPL